MSYQDEAHLTGFVTGLIVGAVIGASAAALMTPQSGPKTRKKLRKSAKELAATSRGRWDDLAEDVKDRVDDAFASARKRVQG
jgi:gas vesicle protein